MSERTPKVLIQANITADNAFHSREQRVRVNYEHICDSCIKHKRIEVNGPAKDTLICSLNRNVSTANRDGCDEHESNRQFPNLPSSETHGQEYTDEIGLRRYCD